LAVLLGACATIPTGARSYRGIVVHVGTDAVLSLEHEAHARAITGPERLRLQLDRIPGASVTIHGRLVGTDRLAARSFVILDPGDGLSPMVGRLAVDQWGVVLQDEVTGTELLLRGAALAEIKRHHGGRVWVTGSIVGPSSVLIAHWGLLLTATEAERIR
jgi:hypothetical protein